MLFCCHLVVLSWSWAWILVICQLNVLLLSSLSVNVDSKTNIIVDDTVHLTYGSSSGGSANPYNRHKINPYYYINDISIIDKEIKFVSSTLEELESTFTPADSKLLQCCANPIESFILREWSGVCACQTLEQKWDRYQDWISLNGGYINPHIKFRYVSEMKPLIEQIKQWRNEYKQLTQRRQEILSNLSPINENENNDAGGSIVPSNVYEALPSVKVKQMNKNGLTNKKWLFHLSTSRFHIHKHERGMYASKHYHKGDTLFKIPFHCAFSQFAISRHIKNTSMFDNPVLAKLFSKPDYFMPDEFPDWDEFVNKTTNLTLYDSFTNTTLISRHVSIRPWLAIGLTWLKKNTYDLLPWLELLPNPKYLPLTWNNRTHRDVYEFANTQAMKAINTLEIEFTSLYPYLDMLNLTSDEVRQMYAIISSRAFGFNFDLLNGHSNSPVIPCGADFLNHNVMKESSMYYDDSLGQHYMSYKNGTLNKSNLTKHEKQSFDKSISYVKKLSYSPPYNVHNNEQYNDSRNDTFLNESDFQLIYLWLNYEIGQFGEMFVNYGKSHTSANRIALFGFIDEFHPWDNIDIRLDLFENDENVDIKHRYFQTVWNPIYLKWMDLSGVGHNSGSTANNENTDDHNNAMTFDLQNENTCINNDSGNENPFAYPMSMALDATLTDNNDDDDDTGSYSIKKLIQHKNLSQWLEKATENYYYITLQFERLNMSVDVYAESNAHDLKELLITIDSYLNSNDSNITFKHVKNSINKFKYLNQHFASSSKRKYINKKKNNNGTNKASNSNSFGNKKYRTSYDTRFFGVSAYQPPLAIEYTGMHSLQVTLPLLRTLRLMFLPLKYFDSFTISSILNENNHEYLNGKIDLFVENGIHSICYNHLKNYPTSIENDKNELKYIEKRRKIIINTLNYHHNNIDNNENEHNRNWTDFKLFEENLNNELQELDRQSLILQYRIREKEYWIACTKIQIVHKFQSRKSRKKMSKNVARNDNSGSLSNSFSATLERFVVDLMFGVSDEFDENENGSDNDSNNENENGGNSWLVELLSQMINGNDNLVGNRIESELNLENSGNENDDEIENDIDIDIGGDSENKNILTKKQLLVGKIREASVLLATTKGWNSPSISNVGALGGNNAMNMLNIANLFGGGGGGNGQTFSISGSNNNIRISGNTITIDNLNLFNQPQLQQQQQQQQQQQIQNTKKEDIPETVPFETMMGGTSFVAVSIDPSGQMRQVGTSSIDLANIDLASLFGAGPAASAQINNNNNNNNGQQNVIRLSNVPQSRKKNDPASDNDGD